MYDVRCTMYVGLIVFRVYKVNKVPYKPYILYKLKPDVHRTSNIVH
jgi:hypothetical protein